MRPRRPLTSAWSGRGFVLLALTLTVGFAGCASSRSAEDVITDRERVLGTWEYRTDGIRALQRGTLRITTRDGILVGRLQDSWRGRLDAQITLRGGTIQLEIDRLRLVGELRADRFTASARRPVWDVSGGVSRRRSTGFLVAQRVRRGTIWTSPTDLSCPSLLREVSYACSPFHSR